MDKDLKQIDKEIEEIQEKLISMADELTIERAELRGRLLSLQINKNELLTNSIIKQHETLN